MRITGLKTDYQVNPIGVDLGLLTFTWQVEETAGTFQKHSLLQIAEDASFEKVVFDSDRDDAEKKGILPAWCYNPDFHGVMGRRYYWKVAVSDNAGESAESEVQYFEGGHPYDTGLRAGGNYPFAGKWIAPAFTSEIHPVFRKKFSLTGEDLQAAFSGDGGRLYICGLGLYEAYLNGAKIGNQFFTPYWTDYRYWCQYQTYDITPYLKEGENVLDVWTGNGWYKGRMGYLAHGQLREHYGNRFQIIADLFLNGRILLSTDDTWECLKSPVISSGIYDGEVYDARKEDVLRNPERRDISRAVPAKAPSFQLTAMEGVPVVKHEDRMPVRLIHTPKDETVLDFGQEVTGWVEFEPDVPAEAEVTLDYGEVLQNGCFYRDNLRTADARYTFVSAGRKEHARAHFTFFGFRYVRVTGMKVSEENLSEFHAVSLYSDLEETGSIVTGNEKVNRLIENTKWSEKDNFLDIPTDCPQRDERLGWTGDAEIFASTASYHMETPQFYRKYMKDMALEQAEKGGAVPYVVPDLLTVGRQKLAEPEYDMAEDRWGEAGASVWGDSATIIPWQSYLHFGNKKLLAEEYTNMKQWVDFIRYMDETYCGGKRLWTCGFHFGDWLSLDVEGDTAGMENREGGTDKYFVASVYYMYSAHLTAEAAEILGRETEAAAYEKLSREVRAAVIERYVTGEGTISIDTQTAYTLGIHFGLFEGEASMKKAGDHLVELLHLWKDHLATGFVGTAYICDALTQTGHVKEAYTLLLNEDYPSWLYEVNLGATTIWERWNSLLPDGSISGTGMNSLNHYAYGSICGWIYEDVCGIRASQDGRDEKALAGQKVVIAPHTDERLGKASAVVRLAAGIYASGWQLDRESGTVAYRFQVPFGGAAEFIPDLTLENLTVNGAPCSDEDLKARIFEKGEYVIEGTIRS